MQARLEAGTRGARPAAPGGAPAGLAGLLLLCADRRADGGAMGCGRGRARGAAGSACSAGRRTPAVPGLQAALPAATAAELLRAVLRFRLLYCGAGRGAGPALPGPGGSPGRRDVGDVCRLRAGSAVPGERAQGSGARGALVAGRGRGGAERRWHPHKGETQEWVPDFEAMATPQGRVLGVWILDFGGDGNSTEAKVRSRYQTLEFGCPRGSDLAGTRQPRTALVIHLLCKDVEPFRDLSSS